MNPSAPTNYRSYVVTYSIGGIFFTQTILGFDSYLDTLALATEQAPEGSRIVGLKELT